MIAALLSFALLFQAQEALQPATYASPSGKRALAIEPIARDSARARMLLDGVEQWSEELPFVPVKAAVAEDGRAAAYAYAIDPSGESGELLVILLAPDGKVLARVPHALKSSRGAHGHIAFTPVVRGLVLQPELGRVILAVYDNEPPDLHAKLWTYDLSTGAPLVRQRADIDEKNDHLIVLLLGLRAIPESPLLLMSWYRRDSSSEPVRRDACFQLLDQDLRIVWTLELPHDYERGGDGRADLRFMAELLDNPPILATPPRRFELRAVAAAQRVLFQVELVEGAWRVSELSRVPY